MFRYLFLLSLISCAHAASIDAVEQNTTVDESADTYEAEAEENTSDKPVYSTPTDEVAKLRAEMAEMKKQMQDMQVKSPSSKVAPASGSLNPASAPQTKSQPKLDDDVTAVLNDLGVDPNNLQEAMGAHNQEEAVAMANAYKSAGTMEVSGVQGEFDKLSALYHNAMREEDKNLIEQAKGACAQFIDVHQDHSLSRSALFYMAKLLLKLNEVKDAQNAFARVYRGDEQGPHAADALLGMAEVFIKENNKAAASKFIEKVKKDFKPEYLTDDTKADLKRLSGIVGGGAKKQQPAVKTPVNKPAAPKANPQQVLKAPAAKKQKAAA